MCTGPACRCSSDTGRLHEERNEELAVLKQELQRAIKRCAHKLDSRTEKRSKAETEALHQLAMQQLEALKELEHELKN
jgi:ribosome-binding ATPase YchF (GTP1/OBG family)